MQDIQVWMKDEMRGEIRLVIRWEIRWKMRWEMRWDETRVEMRQEMIDEIKEEMRHLPFLIFKNLYLFFSTNWKAFIFPPAGATFDGECSSIATFRPYSNISQKKKKFINTMISNTAYSFEKHQKSSIFLCSRPKMAVFLIFQDRFFHGPLISIREGLLRVFIQVPPLFASRNHLSVL